MILGPQRHTDLVYNDVVSLFYGHGEVFNNVDILEIMFHFDLERES